MRKDEEFWKGIQKRDGIVISETWLDEKGWERLAYRLPEGYAWKAQHARKEHKKGRAIGGMAVGIRKELVEEANEQEGCQEEEWITGKVKIGGERWTIAGVYVRKDIERKMEKIKEYVENEGQGRKIIVGGDFNARTGEKGGGYWGEHRKEERGRRSKDKKVNAEGKKLVEGLEEMGWSIMNGNTKGDEEGEITYVGGRGETVIDYAIGDNEVRGRIRGLEIGDRIDSDHHPIIVEVESERWEKTKKNEQRVVKGDWSRTGRERFRTGIRWDREEDGDINETIAERTGEFRRVIEEEASREGEERKRRRGWWDEETKEKKAEVRSALREWRKGGTEVERYRKERGEYNKLCERKKQEENERFVREAEEANTESKVWEVINRERVKKKKTNEKIEKQEWKEYFMNLLGGVEERAEGRENEVRRGEDAEREIGREEVRKAIAKLKDGKSPGGDNIENEV